jgi:hypothetical protein
LGLGLDKFSTFGGAAFGIQAAEIEACKRSHSEAGQRYHPSVAKVIVVP